jgi:hypothetical protein
MGLKGTVTASVAATGPAPEMIVNVTLVRDAGGRINRFACRLHDDEFRYFRYLRLQSAEGCDSRREEVGAVARLISTKFMESLEVS